MRLLGVADLRYAQELAPEVFSSYLAEENGRLKPNRLPADSDPMMARIARIRNQEALFIDTVDEQYVDLGDELGGQTSLATVIACAVFTCGVNDGTVVGVVEVEGVGVEVDML